jgi:hypothetical protein
VICIVDCVFVDFVFDFLSPLLPLSLSAMPDNKIGVAYQIDESLSSSHVDTKVAAFRMDFA